MASKDALRFAAIPLALAGFGLLGFSFLSKVDASKEEQTNSRTAAASPTAPASTPHPKTAPTLPFPKGKLKAEFGLPGQERFLVVSFVSNTEIERITGTVQQEKGAMRGTLNFDGDTLTGDASFTVRVASMRTGIETRDQHLQGEKWLDAAKHPDIAFTVKSLRHVSGDTWRVEGVWAMKGISHDISIPDATMRFIPGNKANELGINYKPTGEAWVRIEAHFPVSITKFDMSPSNAMNKIEDAWKVSVDLMGKVTS